MEPSDDRPDLKLEPTFGQDRCSVSWHADSCLEHYSSIAVYHVTDPEAKYKNANADGGDANPAVPADWRIALRVEPDAEGPSAGKLKLAATENESSRVDRAPAVAVALPSRSAYFLLDDFNHHHQHAVLAGQSHRSGNRTRARCHYLCRDRLFLRALVGRMAQSFSRGPVSGGVLQLGRQRRGVGRERRSKDWMATTKSQLLFMERLLFSVFVVSKNEYMARRKFRRRFRHVSLQNKVGTRWLN
ncbi:unnamed protein product [Ectocarpus sp. 12 AP-2014]